MNKREEEDDGHCGSCAGTGEGDYDGARCPICRGRGVVMTKAAYDDDYDYTPEVEEYYD